MTDLRIQPVDGQWQTLGRGTLIHSAPRGIAPSWNVRGPDALSFDLDVDPVRSSIELREFTPVEYHPDGDDPIWSGFVYDSPRSRTGLSVSCRGWQYAGDHDAHASMYVHGALSELKDTRGYSADPTQLGTFVTPPQVITDGGFVTLVWPKGVPIDPTNCVGVTLDQGPDPDGWATDYDLEGVGIATGITSNLNMIVRCHDNMDKFIAAQGAASGTDYHDPVNAVGSYPAGGWGGTQSIGNHPPRRYWSIILQRNAAAPVITVNASDWGFQIKVFNLYRDPAYRNASLSASALRADHVFTREAARVPQWSTDTSRISTVSFVIPAMGAVREDQTPNEMLARADSYHRFKYGVDALARVYFEPQPAVPDLIVNTRDPGVDYKDTSHNSGAEVYNKVIVTGTSGSGEPLRVVRASASLPTADRIPAVGITIPNASADVDDAWWLKTGSAPVDASTLTRDTTVFQSAPASVRIDAPGSSGTLFEWYQKVAGTFRAGLLYETTVWIRTQLAGQAGKYLTLSFGSFGYDNATVSIPTDSGYWSATAWQPITVQWTPKFDVVSTTDPLDTQAVQVRVGALTGIATATSTWVDDLAITQGVASMPDRRGFMKSKTLEVQAPTDPAAMTLLGDVWLNQHLRPPFKGTLDLSAAVVKAGGRRLHPREVAARAGDLIRLADVVDPYTGAKGRDAIMASGSASERSSASIALDDDRSSFEALMSRMQVVQGN